MLQWTGGRELVAAAGLLFIGIAAYQAYLGLSRKFLSYSKTSEMPAMRSGLHARSASSGSLRGPSPSC